MDKDNGQLILKKLDGLTDLLQNLLALELFREGVPKAKIAKRLHVAKAKVVEMLKGVRDE